MAWKTGGWRGHPNSLAAILKHGVRFPIQPQWRSGWRNHQKTNAQLALIRMEHAGLLPGELVALPMWQQLAGLPPGPRSTMRLQLVLAWGKRDREPLAWAKTQRRAMDMGRTAP